MPGFVPGIHADAHLNVAEDARRYDNGSAWMAATSAAMTAFDRC
jgi:hypothetical protein